MLSTRYPRVCTDQECGWYRRSNERETTGNHRRRLAPLPGINAVIGAATIEANNRGFEVIGFYDGFRWLASDDFHRNTHTIKLESPNVARIHFDGGSILRTSRTSLLDDKRRKTHTLVAPDPAKVGEVTRNLRALGITHLMTIGVRRHGSQRPFCVRCRE